MRVQISAIVRSNLGRSKWCCIDGLLRAIFQLIFCQKMSFCFCFTAGLGGSPTVAQSPVHKSVTVGDTVSLSCTASSGVDNDLSWYLIKPGMAPQLLFYKINTHHSGTPSRFSSSGSEPEFTLTISGVQAEDAGDYYCLGVYSGPVFTQ